MCDLHNVYGIFKLLLPLALMILTIIEGIMFKKKFKKITLLL